MFPEAGSAYASRPSTAGRIVRHEQLEANPSGFDDLIGAEVVEASGQRCVIELAVTAAHHQPFGIVHGGVYATLVETATSIGASLWLDGEAVAVGIGNSTEFLRSVRDGRLICTATPLQQGRRLQLWAAEVVDEDGRLVAHGKVRLLNRSAEEG